MGQRAALPGGGGPAGLPDPFRWSLLWRTGPDTDPHPRLEDLLRAFTTEAARSRRLEYDPARDWLPDADEAALRP
ncbi:hypothetical protein ACFRAR_03010 [Kitasatospora sp. NPDC056651]|uniref:hypothetical protein n=1 Tax=Kitasatospora sp. NPDC056651 TaxID=3345892 RepID=UPI00369FF0F2